MNEFTFERLEQRQLLAATIKKSGVNLIIVGNNEADTIFIEGDGEGNMGVTINGEFKAWEGVTNLKIKTGGGSDNVRLVGLDIRGNVLLITGDGNDTIALDSFDTIGGNLKVKTGSGNDTVTLGVNGPFFVGGITNINLGSGDDTLNVNFATSKGPIKLNGSKGTDTLNLGGNNLFDFEPKIKGFEPT